MNEGIPKQNHAENLPVIDMKKNSDGVFEFSKKIGNIKPFKFDMTVGHGIRFKYLNEIKKVAREKNIKINIHEKSIDSGESKFDITINGNMVDAESFWKWHNEFVNDLKKS